MLSQKPCSVSLLNIKKNIQYFINYLGFIVFNLVFHVCLWASSFNLCD